MNTPTDLSAYCQSTAGISANHLVEFSGVPRRTLYDWWHKKPRLIQLIVKGIKFELQKTGDNLMKTRHEGLKVLVQNNHPIMTLSKHTFVSCHIEGDNFVIVLHHKDGYLSDHYYDHTYRVPIAENNHLKECLHW